MMKLISFKPSTPSMHDSRLTLAAAAVCLVLAMYKCPSRVGGTRSRGGQLHVSQLPTITCSTLFACLRSHSSSMVPVILSLSLQRALQEVAKLCKSCNNHLVMNAGRRRINTNNRSAMQPLWFLMVWNDAGAPLVTTSLAISGQRIASGRPRSRATGIKQCRGDATRKQ